MESNYIISTQRLGLRNWKDSDLKPYASLCKDPEVMQYFPKIATLEDVTAQVHRFKNHFKTHGYTYFAAEILETQEFIGFIGMAWQDWESPYTPNTDIGWRLKKSAWGKGYATEGAKACIENAHKLFGLKKIISVASIKNSNSIKIMKKIGMQEVGIFEHPKLLGHPHLNPCLAYIIVL